VERRKWRNKNKNRESRDETKKRKTVNGGRKMEGR
jgi:hypothetical protein